MVFAWNNQNYPSLLTLTAGKPLCTKGASWVRGACTPSLTPHSASHSAIQSRHESTLFCCSRKVHNIPTTADNESVGSGLTSFRRRDIVILPIWGCHSVEMRMPFSWDEDVIQPRAFWKVAWFLIESCLISTRNQPNFFFYLPHQQIPPLPHSTPLKGLCTKAGRIV